MPNWKTLQKDEVQDYWIKNLCSLHERVAVQINKILMGDDSLPAWMTHGRTVLCQDDPRKANAVENYRSITCLPLMWKLLTGVIAEEMYDYLEPKQLLSEKQKGSRAGSMINECMELFGIAENVRNFLEKSMEQWKLSLTSNGEDLEEVDVKRGIFQGDSLSSLLFVLSMVPLSLTLRNVNTSYEWGKKEYKLNHLLFMDDLKVFSKSEEQIDTLVRTAHAFSTDIGMEFVKCLP